MTRFHFHFACCVYGRLPLPKVLTTSGSFDFSASASKNKLKKYASGTGFIALKERSGTSLLRRSSEMVSHFHIPHTYNTFYNFNLNEVIHRDVFKMRIII
jgi:hypothetical protein